jgi:hypothetical protein
VVLEQWERRPALVGERSPDVPGRSSDRGRGADFGDHGQVARVTVNVGQNAYEDSNPSGPGNDAEQAYQRAANPQDSTYGLNPDLRPGLVSVRDPRGPFPDERLGGRRHCTR